MKRIMLAAVLAVVSTPLFAHCDLGNGEVLELGREITIPYEPNVKKLAAKLFESGEFATMEDAIAETQYYDGGLAVAFTCKQVVTVTKSNKFEVVGFALVPSWQDLSHYPPY